MDVQAMAIWQRNFDMYRQRALEHGYTGEEIGRAEQRVKWLYRNRRLSDLPRQLALIWASHRLLEIERETDGMF